jgi:hypothetical protein
MAIHSWKSQYIHICMVFGNDLLCDLLEMLNFNKYRSAVASRRNLSRPNSVEEYKQLDGIAVRALDLRTEGYRFETHLFFISMCNLFST